MVLAILRHIADIDLIRRRDVPHVIDGGDALSASNNCLARRRYSIFQWREHMRRISNAGSMRMSVYIAHGVMSLAPGGWRTYADNRRQLRLMLAFDFA